MLDGLERADRTTEGVAALCELDRGVEAALRPPDLFERQQDRRSIVDAREQGFALARLA